MQCMFTKIAMVDFEIVQTGCVIILSATLTIKVVHLVSLVTVLLLVASQSILSIMPGFIHRGSQVTTGIWCWYQHTLK